MAATIQDLFGGKVGEFIEYETLILPEALQGELEQEFERLSPVEREIIQLIARENGATTFPKLLGKLQLSASEVVNAIQSLKMRLLLEGIQQDNSTLLVLNPLWQQYGLVAE